MSRVRHEHLILQEKHMRCRNCGAMQQITTPQFLKSMTKQVGDFIGRHEQCLPKKYEGSDT